MNMAGSANSRSAIKRDSQSSKHAEELIPDEDVTLDALFGSDGGDAVAEGVY
jgi:hypothetical protein